MIQKNSLRLTRKIARGIFAGLFLLIVCLFGYTTIARVTGNPLPTVFGWGSAVVLSGSMEPELPVGTLILIHKENSYKAGEIVTYEDEYGNLVTHRLVSLENGEAITKGDANNTEDASFTASKIYGKVKAVLPGVGGIILWLKTPLGICTILLIGGLLIIISSYFKRKVDQKNAQT